MLSRAWASLQIKAVDASAGTLEGIATTPATDRTGDIVEPGGAEFSLPIKLLSHHDQRRPIGNVTQAKASAAGIWISGTIPKGTGLAYVDEAWSQITSGLVGGLSIGFRALEYSPILDAKGERTGGYRFKRWQWLELSAVTIPANAEATIQTIKLFDPWGAWAHAHSHELGGDDGQAQVGRYEKTMQRAAAAIVQARRLLRTRQ